MTEFSTQQSATKPFSRLYHRLEVACKNRQFYESHQLYRTLFNRLSNVNREEAERVLDEGANFLLSNNQSESGADLVGTLVRFYIANKRQPSESIVLRLKNHLARMAKRSSERQSALLVAVQWLRGAGDAAMMALFHDWVAMILWREDDYEGARAHLLLAGNGPHTAMLLLAAHLTRGYPRERDLFLTQAVLQFLCLDKLASASAAFFVYVRNHPDLGHGPPFPPDNALLNFAWFLMAAIELRLGEAVFTCLCARYQRHLDRDPLYREYLARIGQIHFHMAPQSSRETAGVAAAAGKTNDGLISSIMSMLMGGGSGADETGFTSEDMD